MAGSRALVEGEGPGSEMGGGKEENLEPRLLLLSSAHGPISPGPSAALAPPLHLIPLLNLRGQRRASLPYVAGDATSGFWRVQTRAAESLCILRTIACAIDHEDDTQL